MRIRVFVLSILLAFAAVGISLETSAQRLATSAPNERFDFAKKKITIGKRTIEVEIADTPRLREHGLMFRKSLAADSGMLFVFDHEQPMAFWMKNTLIPLSIAYFDKNRRIVDIKEMVPAVLGEAYPPNYPSRAPAMYALEMPKGWFAKNGIKIGHLFSFAQEADKKNQRP